MAQYRPQTLAICPTPMRRSSASMRLTKATPLVGAESRPSVKQCTKTFFSPRRAASSIHPNTCSSRECTPMSLASPIRCSWLSRVRHFSTAATNSALLKKDSSWMALLMRTDSWSTIRPAPMFWWPTSLLPIVPWGNPTSSPLVATSVKGHSARSRASTGGRASLTALARSHFGSGFSPQPSRTIRTHGRCVIVLEAIQIPLSAQRRQVFACMRSSHPGRQPARPVA
jgi:hypothetical protein